MSHFSQDHITTVYFLKFVLISPFCLFFPRVVYIKILFTFLAPHVWYMLLSHIIYFDVIILILFGIVKNAIKLIMPFSSLTSYLISPTAWYSPQHFCLQTLSIHVLPSELQTEINFHTELKKWTLVSQTTKLYSNSEQRILN